MDHVYSISYKSEFKCIEPVGKSHGIVDYHLFFVTCPLLIDKPHY